MPNKWLAHIKKTMKQMKSKGTYKKGMGLKQVILAAKKTWHKKGGGSCMTGGEGSDEEKSPAGLVDVPLTGAPATTGMEKADKTVSEEVAGGRRRKTRRRRHSRRH
jgi:hypothetical protein